EAADTLKAFAEKFNIPFAETQAGKSAIESTHPLNVGGIGVTGNSAANKLAREANLIIGVGTRFTDFTTSSKQLFQHDNVDFVTINISEFHAGKFDAAKVVADAKTGLGEIERQLMKADYQSGYSDEVTTAKKEWQEELNRLYQTDFKKADFKPEIAGHLDEQLSEYEEALNSSLTQTAVIGRINETIADD